MPNYHLLPIGLISANALAFAPARIIPAVSYRLASIRPLNDRHSGARRHRGRFEARRHRRRCRRIQYTARPRPAGDTRHDVQPSDTPDYGRLHSQPSPGYLNLGAQRRTRIADPPLSLASRRRHPNSRSLARSHRLDLRFLGGFRKPLGEDDIAVAHTGGQPVEAVTLLIGYGAAPINVFYVGNRLILNNGFHRVVALRAEGITHIPAVIQRVAQAEIEFPEQLLAWKIRVF